MRNDFQRGSEWRIWDLQVQTIIDDCYIELQDYYENLKSSSPEKWEKFITLVGGEENALKFDSRQYFNDSAIDINLRCTEYVRTFFAFCETYKPNLGCVLLSDHNYDHEILYDKFYDYSLRSALKIIPGVEINVGGIHTLIAFETPPFNKTTFSDGIKTFLDKIEVHSRKSQGVLTVCSAKTVIDIMRMSDDTSFLYVFPHCNSSNGLFQERNKTDRTNLANIFNYHKNVILQSKCKKSIDDVLCFIKSKPFLSSSPIPTISPDSRSLKDIASPDAEGNLLWIKANPTFNGLKQILVEPSDRVFIGEVPPKIEFVNDHKNLFIDSISIISKKDENEWFDKCGVLELNSGLVSIIGNKGSGKSALADIIGMTGNADINKFSFLDSNKFLRHNSSKKYTANIKLLDNFENNKQFSKPAYVNEFPSKVVYLSQYFVQELCEDLSTSRLQAEINRVIFSHIPKEERYEFVNLDSLIDDKKKSINTQIAVIKAQIADINNKIEDYELNELPANLEKLNNKLSEKKRQLEEVRNEKPIEINEPSAKLPSEIEEKIKLFKSKIVKDENDLRDINYQTEQILLDKKNLTEVIEKLDYIRIIYDDIKQEIEKNAAIIKYSIDVNKLLTLTADEKILKDKIIKVEEEIEKAKDKKKILETSLDASKNGLKVINKKLGDDQKIYQSYKDNLLKWEKKQNEIIGDKDIIDTIKYYTEKINFIKSVIPVKLTELRKERLSKAEKILSYLVSIKDFYPSIYKFSEDYATFQANHFNINNNFITFDAKLRFTNDISQKLFECINRQRKGYFQGLDDSEKKIQSILSEVNINSVNELLNLPDTIIKLIKDYSVNNQQIDFDSQLTKTRRELYNLLFSFDYLEIKFEIKYSNEPISNLSPGERGTLLLILYLLIDKDKRPIIIDQPEENLDNETVYLRLVKFIKQVKSERQIIIVTHNPNLAVVCDSEQIIYAQIDKSNNNLISYISGSIEDPVIKEKVLNVLEGTVPAFTNRKNKYNI